MNQHLLEQNKLVNNKNKRQQNNYYNKMNIMEVYYHKVSMIEEDNEIFHIIKVLI